MHYRSTATETAQGRIPHLRIVHEGMEILAPVMIETDEWGRAKTSRPGNATLPHPLRHLGKLVYALPGGGEVRA